MSSHTGIILNNGKEISGSDLDKLTPEEVKELAETHATKWDILLLRQMNHDTREDLQKLVFSVEQITYNMRKGFDEIKEELIIETGNGKKEPRQIKIVLGELYEQHRPDRKRKRLMQSLREYRIHLIVLSGAILFFSVAFLKYLTVFLQLIKDNTLQAIGMGLIPILILGLTKWVINKSTK